MGNGMASISYGSRTILLLMAGLLSLSACGLNADENTNYPKTEEDRRRDARGKLTGDEGLTVGGGGAEKEKDAGKNPLGVNSFLWRATLDTLSFLPISAADPFGGTILTDWYEDPDALGERFKVNVLILDRQLRADSLKITTFRQKKDAKGNWADAPTDAKLGRKLEDTVLTRARELRVKQLGY
jgi:hypothetical protein